MRPESHTDAEALPTRISLTYGWREGFTCPGADGPDQPALHCRSQYGRIPQSRIFPIPSYCDRTDINSGADDSRSDCFGRREAECRINCRLRWGLGLGRDRTGLSQPDATERDWSVACPHALRHCGTPLVLVDAVDGKCAAECCWLSIACMPWPLRAMQLTGVCRLARALTDLCMLDDPASLDQAGGAVSRPANAADVGSRAGRLAYDRRCYAGLLPAVGWSSNQRGSTFPLHHVVVAGLEDPAGRNCRRAAAAIFAALGSGLLRLSAGKVTAEVTKPRAQRNWMSIVRRRVAKIEARSWKGAAGTALIHDPVRTAFYRHYAQAACRRGTLRLCWLRFGATTVAVQFAIEEGRRFWLLKIGYDEEFARCSPGNLLVCETLRYAVRPARAWSPYEFSGAERGLDTGLDQRRAPHGVRARLSLQHRRPGRKLARSEMR